MRALVGLTLLVAAQSTQAQTIEQFRRDFFAISAAQACLGEMTDLQLTELTALRTWAATQAFGRAPRPPAVEEIFARESVTVGADASNAVEQNPGRTCFAAGRTLQRMVVRTP